MGTQGEESEKHPESSQEPSTSGSEPAEARGSRGGRALVNKYGSRYMAEIGRKGSHSVVKKYGLRFYSEIASRNKGVKKRRASGSDEQE